MAIAIGFALSLTFGPVASAQSEHPVTLTLPRQTVSTPARLRAELTRLIGAPVVRPGDRRATSSRGTLSILVDAEGSTAYIRYRRRGHRDPILVVVRTATSSRDALWAAEAGAAVVRTVDEWRAAHTEVLDPGLAGHRVDSLSDPFPEQGVRPAVAVEFVFVGQDIVDPWREALRSVRQN